MKLLGMGMGRRLPPAQVEEESEPKRSTPVYARDPVRTRRKAEVVKGGDDLLVDLMLDGEYREFSRVVEILPDCRWVDAVAECVRRGYAFDRDGSRLRMRRRGVAERRQTTFEVVEGLTVDDLRERPATRKAEPKVAAAEAREVEEVPPQVVDVPDTGLACPRLSLSDGEDPLTLTVTECSTMTAAILAKKSSGKTYLGMVLVEEIMKSGSGVPVVVVDPTGVWAPGLRCMSDGTPSPYQVLTLGGPHGDFPLRSDQGAAAAEVVERVRPYPVILDLSALEPAGQHEVAADFGERIYATDKRSPLLLIVDEADEFVPQALTGSANQKRSLEIWDRIVRRGRIKGLGTVLISQRAAVVNKNVLSQIDKLFLLKMVAPPDLEAADEWLRYVVSVGQRARCLGQLPSLQPGQAFYMCAGATPPFRRFVVRRRATYDSSRTPEAADGERVLELSRVSSEVLETARQIMESSPTVEGES